MKLKSLCFHRASLWFLFFTVVGPQLTELSVSFVIYLGEHTGSVLQRYIS